jgi:Cu2+-containing amine oxidase
MMDATASNTSVTNTGGHSDLGRAWKTAIRDITEKRICHRSAPDRHPVATMFAVFNPSTTNAVGNRTAYQIVPLSHATMLLHQSEPSVKRAAFVRHDSGVTPIMQTNDTPGVPTYLGRKVTTT